MVRRTALPGGTGRLAAVCASETPRASSPASATAVAGRHRPDHTRMTVMVRAAVERTFGIAGKFVCAAASAVLQRRAPPRTNPPTAESPAASAYLITRPGGRVLKSLFLNLKTRSYKPAQ